MYSFVEKNKVQILQVDNLLDALDNQKIIAEIEDLIQQKYINFIIDLEAMSYMNSTGLTFLISILTRARSAGGDVAIANLSDNIKKILLVTRLNSAFSVQDNIEEALKVFEPIAKQKA